VAAVTAPDVPDGFALLCKTCRLRLANDATMAVVEQHFALEHQTTDLRLELVAICPRCDEPMRHDYTLGLVDVFACDRCHRTRRVRRDPPPTAGATP